MKSTISIWLIKYILIVFVITSCNNNILQNSSDKTILKYDLGTVLFLINLPPPIELQNVIELSDHTRGNDKYYLKYIAKDNCKITASMHNFSNYSISNVTINDSLRIKQRLEVLRGMIIFSDKSSRETEPIALPDHPRLYGLQYDEGLILSYSTTTTNILLNISNIGNKNKVKEILNSIVIKPKE